MPLQPVSNLINPLDRDHPRLDGRAAGGHFVDPADIHLAIVGQRQRARDRRCRHRKQMRRGFGFTGQEKALRHAEAMLFVDHRQPQLLVAYRFLKNRVSADENVDAAIGQPHQRRFAHPPLVTTRQDRDPDINARKQTRQAVEMLPRENFGRRE